MKHPKADMFKQLTWSDIKAWAGINVTSRGQRYQCSLEVQELACTSNSGLLAWVKGTKTYATLVDIEEEELTSACTCPYEDVFKHAVAVVLEYLEKLNQNIQVPTVAEGDPRLTLLENTQEEAWHGQTKTWSMWMCNSRLHGPEKPPPIHYTPTWRGKARRS